MKLNRVKIRVTAEDGKYFLDAGFYLVLIRFAGEYPVEAIAIPQRVSENTARVVDALHLSPNFATTSMTLNCPQEEVFVEVILPVHVSGFIPDRIPEDASTIQELQRRLGQFEERHVELLDGLKLIRDRCASWKDDPNATRDGILKSFSVICTSYIDKPIKG